MKSTVLYFPHYWEKDGFQIPPHTLAVVVDVLRATSTMVTAFGSGVSRIYPVIQVDDAFDVKNRDPHVILAGERGGLRVSGFDFGNSPREFLKTFKKHSTLVMSTSNGTKAFHAARKASRVIVGSFLNRQKVLDEVKHWEGPVVFFCSGTDNDFAWEDAAFVGDILAEIEPHRPAASIYRQVGDDLFESFCQTKNGAILVRLGLKEDIRWCLQRDLYDLLPVFDPQSGMISC